MGDQNIDDAGEMKSRWMTHPPTESRLVELDQGQEDVVRKIAEQKPRNIFLWGSSGTGKTLMLVEALLMKISQYRREGRRVKVIVSSFVAYSDEDSLMVDFKQRYLTSLVDKENVSFVTTRALCQQLGVEYDRYQPQSTLTSVSIYLSIFSIILGLKSD